MKIYHVLFFTLVLALLSSCQKLDPQMDSITGFNSGSPHGNEIWIQGMAFIPTTLSVRAGTTVTFINKDYTDHTVTADNNTFDSGTLKIGKSYSREFPVTGVYNFHCTLHPEMKGTIIVN
jgi:plastocyanin